MGSTASTGCQQGWSAAVALRQLDVRMQLPVQEEQGAHFSSHPHSPPPASLPPRRHGIQRWPRRQLQKVNRALDELEARQMMQPQQHLLPVPAGGSMGGLAVPGYGVGELVLATAAWPVMPLAVLAGVAGMHLACSRA